jgi:isocitrate dehydrogenase
MEERMTSLKYPDGGAKITVQNNQLVVPNNPIIGFIKGDGIGPDVMHACLRMWDAAITHAYGDKRKVYWTELFLGEAAAERYDGNIYPAETREALKDLLVSIKGPLTTPVGKGFRSLNVSLRQDLDLYACIRPVQYFNGLPSPLKNPELVDVVIFRENTEDVYAGIEYASGSPEMRKLEKFLKEELGAKFFDDSGLGIKPISPFASKRLMRKAMQFAIDNKRESVTIVHKGNIMKFTEGAFRAWCYEVAHEEFGNITITEEELYRDFGGKQPAGKILIKDRIADNMFQLMLLQPNEFDVLVSTNLNGDYLSDSIAAEVGGIGIAPGANMSDFIGVFEATHGTAPKLANLDMANPGSLLFSGAMMFQYLGWSEVADIITHSYTEVINKKIVTCDFFAQMDGATEVGTSGFADAVIAEINRGVNVEAVRTQQQAKEAAERKAREEERVSRPTAKMLETGRTPMTAGDIMKRNLIGVPHDATVAMAMQTMRTNGVSSVLLQPANSDQAWSIMTQKDIVTKVIHANLSPSATMVRDIASPLKYLISPETSLHECVTLLTLHNIRRIVIGSKDGTPIGLVSDTDIFRTVQEFGLPTE